MDRTVAVVSGGIDSVVLAHHLHAEGHQLSLLSIDYGQRHRKEHEFARRTAERLKSPHEVADLRAIGTLLPGNALTDSEVGVPDHGGEVSGVVNVVPNRNVILLSVAFAKATAENADNVAIGTVAGDADTGPDCSPAFLSAFNAMERVACAGFAPENLAVVAPFIEMPKHEVIRLGQALGVPWQETWSCFRGGVEQCGVCATCYDRRTSFEKAEVHDPTVYARD